MEPNVKQPEEAKPPDQNQNNSTPAEDKSGNDSGNREKQPEKGPNPHRRRKWILIGVGALAGLVIAVILLWPWISDLFNTVSTDDAYVNGHVTFVAARVSGQVTEVYVEDNDRVSRGDLLVELDKAPYLVQLEIKRSALRTAEADLQAAKAQVRGLEALARSQRWQLELSIQQVAGQVANLRANVAAYRSKLASLELAKSNLQRGQELSGSGGVSKEELDSRQQAVKTASSAVEQSLQSAYAIRVNLGLTPRPKDGDLDEVPADLEQTYPGVQSALASLTQTMAQIGLPLLSVKTKPKQVLKEFDEHEAHGDLDRTTEEQVQYSPAVQQAAAKVEQTRQDVKQAELNLSYCDVVSDIDGIVTRRNVNAGNNVSPQQALMAVRSIEEIWIDANFKESQLEHLRVGQRVRCEVDMYGSHHEFQGRITGFSMGTGAALSLLPPQNATGNFVKIVQRLPVRIELTDYHPDQFPLFVGLSVVPYVYYKEAATGKNAGNFLRRPMTLPKRPVPSVNSRSPVIPPENTRLGGNSQ